MEDFEFSQKTYTYLGSPERTLTVGWEKGQAQPLKEGRIHKDGAGFLFLHKDGWYVKWMTGQGS